MGTALDQEWKKGSAELLILSLLKDQPRHGYDIGKLIESRSGGKLRFHIARYIRCSTGLSIAVGFRGAGSKDPIKEGGVTTV